MKKQPLIQLLIEFGPAEYQGAMIWIPAPRHEPVRTGILTESGVIA